MLKGFRTWNEWKAKIKKNIICSGHSLEAKVASGHCPKTKVMTKFKNIYEAKKIIAKRGDGLKFSDEEIQLMCVPDNPRSLEAYQWLANFFKLVGDYAPNRHDKIQLPGMFTKESINSIYAHHISSKMTANEHNPLEVSAFCGLWKNIFPNVTISRYLS